MNEPLQIVIADDHPMFRSGLRQTIESDRRFEVVAEADNGEAALRLLEEHRPDIVILDVSMPGMGGFAVAKEIKRKNLGCEIVFLTMHGEEAMFNKAMSLGAKGYVLKDSAAVDIINCLGAVAKDQNYTSPAVTTFLFKRVVRGSSTASGLEDLTPAELTVLRLIAEYKTSKEIAEELSVSYRTVENHRYKICSKLNVSGSNALVKFALQNAGKI